MVVGAQFSATVRSWHRVARAIADLDGATDLTSQHLAEALSYRALTS
jgi:predicted ATPase with chaperone activity